MKIIAFIVVGVLIGLDVSGQVRGAKGRNGEGCIRPQFPPYGQSRYIKPYDQGKINVPTEGSVAATSQTFLAGYYETYSGSQSAVSFYSYTSLLCDTNFSGIVEGNTYVLADISGNLMGYVSYASERRFRIYDNGYREIGSVKLNKPGRKFAVYDLYGQRVHSNYSRYEMR